MTLSGKRSREKIKAVIAARPQRKGAFLSVQAFVAESGLSKRMVWHELRSLEQEGVIEVTRRSHSGDMPNQYRLIGP